MKNWREILESVQEAKTPCFLLPKILEQIPEGHHLAEFEFWLNHQSGLTDEENALVREKIVGKKVPRHTYQAFFPIGMGKQFPGSHLVAAHLSPDLDTTVASFFGWLDAFAARVAQKQHYWAIAGAPNWQLFSETIHPQLFAKLARTNPSLTLSAQDLINQQAMHQVTSDTHVSTLDHQGDSMAIVLVDEEGHFIGDWQSCDVEPVRQVTILFKACLHWLQHHIHQTLTTLLAQETVSPFVEELLATPVSPIDEFDDTQKEKFLLFLSDILNMTDQLTLQSLLHAIENAIPNTFQPLLERLAQWPIDEMIDNRPQLFQWLQQTFLLLDRACRQARDWAEQLSVAIAIKHDVLQIPQDTLLLQTEVSTIRQKMGDKPFLTVLSGFIPVGVIFSKDIHSTPLGTVSLRDFCNEEEMNLASYLQVISVVDHHKSQLITKIPPLALIGDTQSTNVLIAEATFALNDRHQSNPYWIAPERERLECLLFLHAILDDTDLLTKVCERDVILIADLLKRLSNESITLEDTTNFAQKGAEKLLQTQTLKTLLSQIQTAREAEVETHLKTNIDALFADTKVLNRCCRVSQTKVFPNNIPSLQHKLPLLRTTWATKADEIYTNQPHLDLHLHMISTIPTDTPTSHSDELWFFVPPTTQSKDHLISFLSAFRTSPQLTHQEMSLSLYGSNYLEELFDRFFLPLPIENHPSDHPFAVLHIPASSLNSRKSMIAPYLPKLVV